MSTSNNEGSIEERLRRVEDRLAIYQLISAYGPAADSCNMELIAKLWHEGCTYEVGGLGVYRGHEGLKEAFDGEFHQGIVRDGSAHASTLPHVVIEGDRATATHYGTLFIHRDGQFSLLRLIASRWVLLRTSQGWQIEKRTNVPLNGDPKARELLARVAEGPAVAY